MNQWAICAVVAVLGAGGAAIGQSVVFVRAGLATGADNGSSWADAFRGRMGLASALASIPSGVEREVWVAAGVYAPAAAGGDRNVPFSLKSGLTILGGFAGDETSASQRDPVAHATILSGDLNSNDGAGIEHIEDNSMHVVRASLVDVTGAIDGFTIRDGAAFSNMPAESLGGGLLVEGGAPTIRNCVFTDCHADEAGAGAAFVGATSALVEDCAFAANQSQRLGAGAYVGALSTTTIRGCTFSTNIGGRGAGLFTEGGTPLIEGCLFFENLAQIGGVAGGGYMDSEGQPTLRRCDFIRNATFGGGGGVFLQHSDATISQCRFFANVGSFDVGDAAFVDGGSPTFVSCLMRGNSAATPTLIANPSGCIVHVHGFDEPSHVTFINCTLAGNSRGIFGGPAISAVLVQPGCVAEFINSLIWDNSGFTGAEEGAQIHLNMGGGASFDHCSVQGWTGSLPGSASGALDPLFVDADGVDGVLGTADDDIGLGAGSACIDSGSNLGLPAGEALDAAGMDRTRNDPATSNSGAGISPIVDRGAIEFQAPPCAGDANEDGAVDFADITFVLAHWGEPFGFNAVTQSLALWGSVCP